jgi:hypothetical protein
VGGFGPLGRLEPTFHRASEEQLHQAFIPWPRRSRQSVFALVDSLDLEFLPGFDVIPATDFGWQDDLTFRGNGGPHEM